MKLAIILTIAIALSSARTTGGSGPSTCTCDRRDRALMGYAELEVSVDGRELGIFGPGGPNDLPDQSQADPNGPPENIWLPPGQGGDILFPGSSPCDGTLPCCMCYEDGPFVDLEVPEVVCCNQGGGGGGGGGKARKLMPKKASAYQTRPEGSPSFEAVSTELMDDEIGLFKLHDFLNEDEVDEMKRVLDASSDMFWDCKLDKCKYYPEDDFCRQTEGATSRTHPEGKKCLLFTSDVKKALPADHSALWMDMLKKFQSVWPEHLARARILAQQQVGDVGPMHFHVDGESQLRDKGILTPVSILVYLKDGENPTYFPKANNGEGLFVTPVAGMAITWYNEDIKGAPLKSSVHGVLPGEATEGRMIIQNYFEPIESNTERH